MHVVAVVVQLCVILSPGSRLVLKLWICLIETVKLLVLFGSMSFYMRIFFVSLLVMDVIA